MAKRFFLFILLMPENRDVLNVHFRIALFKLSAKCLASYIARGATFKMTCDDVDKIEKCIKILLGPQSLNMVRFLTSTLGISYSFEIVNGLIIIS
jgi:hypothetical protein